MSQLANVLSECRTTVQELSDLAVTDTARVQEYDTASLQRYQHDLRSLTAAIQEELAERYEQGIHEDHA